MKNKIDEGTRIYVEGNNGGNFVEIIKLDDNRVHLRIGDCCVITIDVILTAEVFSNFLTQVWFRHMKQTNMGFLEFINDTVSNEGNWVGEIRRKMFQNCIDNIDKVHISL